MSYYPFYHRHPAISVTGFPSGCDTLLCRNAYPGNDREKHLIPLVIS